jgi:hypothetical protein
VPDEQFFCLPRTPTVRLACTTISHNSNGEAIILIDEWNLNFMDSKTLATSQTTNLKVNFLLETKDDGSVIASILELPQYRVEAATRERALTMLEELLTQCMNKVEIIPREIQLPSAEQSQKPWMKFAGVFKDDPDFDAVQQYIQEYRQELDAAVNEADSSIYRDAT